MGNSNNMFKPGDVVYIQLWHPLAPPVEARIVNIWITNRDVSYDVSISKNGRLLFLKGISEEQITGKRN